MLLGRESVARVGREPGDFGRVAEPLESGRERPDVTGRDEHAVGAVGDELWKRADPGRDHRPAERTRFLGGQRERLLHERGDDDDVEAPRRPPRFGAWSNSPA